MAAPTELRKGKAILYGGAPHIVIEMLHRTQGRQAGFVQTTLRNLESGSTTTTKFRSTDSVEILHTESRELEFSYKDETGYHFMDPETFEDTVLPTKSLEDQKDFLIENQLYSVLFVDDRPLRLNLPSAVEMEIIDAPEGVRGDTASNVQKPVTAQTGITVQVPLFVKKGDRVRISTDDKSYLGRA